MFLIGRLLCFGWSCIRNFIIPYFRRGVSYVSRSGWHLKTDSSPCVCVWREWEQSGRQSRPVHLHWLNWLTPRLVSFARLTWSHVVSLPIAVGSYRWCVAPRLSGFVFDKNKISFELLFLICRGTNRIRKGSTAKMELRSTHRDGICWSGFSPTLIPSICQLPFFKKKEAIFLF